MHRRERALAIADGRTLVSDDAATVAWLTGLAPDRERGNAPFFVPPVVVLDERGIRVVVSADEADGADEGVEPVTFPPRALRSSRVRPSSTSGPLRAPRWSARPAPGSRSSATS